MNDVSRRWRTTVVAAAVLLAGVLPGGCVTETHRADGPVTVTTKSTSKRKPTGATRQTAAKAPGNPSSPSSPSESTDPCAMRLHDLSGLLLMYYAVNKRLPESLDELQSLTDVDTEFHTECPASGRPYVYAPAAIPPAGSDQFLVLYDAVPAHRGLRWGVFILPPHERQPPTTKVILMSEVVFRNYVPKVK
jgi:hypothetical protein